MNKIKTVGLVSLITSLIFCSSTVYAKEQEKKEEKDNVVTMEELVERQGTSSKYVVSEVSLNIRELPSEKGDIALSVAPGTELKFFKEYPLDENWSAIWYGDDIKYVYSNFIAEEAAETVVKQAAPVEEVVESVPEVVIVPQEEEVYVEPEPEPVQEEPAAEPVPETEPSPEPEPVEEPAPEPEPVYEEPSSTYLGSYCITHYCNCSACCGQWAGGGTASGAYPTSWHTIATGSEFAFGTQLMINGTVYTVEDRGVGNGCIDIYCDSHDEALSRGMFYADVYLVG